MFSTESRTLAMSDNLTAAPFRYATISGSYSFALSNWSLASNVRSRPFVGELSFGDVRVLLAQHRAHVFQSESGVIQLCRINLHPHAWQRAASDIHLTDTFNLKQPLLHDGGCRIVKLPRL